MDASNMNELLRLHASSTPSLFATPLEPEDPTSSLEVTGTPDEVLSRLVQHENSLTRGGSGRRLPQRVLPVTRTRRTLPHRIWRLAGGAIFEDLVLSGGRTVLPLLAALFTVSVAVVTSWALGEVQPVTWVRPLIGWLGLLAVGRSFIMVADEPVESSTRNASLDGSPHSLLEWTVLTERTPMLMNLIMELRRDLEVGSAVRVSLHRMRAEAALEVKLCSGYSATVAVRLAPVHPGPRDTRPDLEERVRDTFRVTLLSPSAAGFVRTRAERLRLLADRTRFTWERERLDVQRARLSGESKPLNLENLERNLASVELLLDAVHELETRPPGQCWTGGHEVREAAV